MSEATPNHDYVYAIAASPDFGRDGVCFVARESGLYRFDAHSGDWRDAYASLNLPAALVTPAVALSPAYDTDRTVFAGTNGGVLRSEDGGETWVLGVMPKPAPVVSAVALSPGFATDGLLFAGTMEDGLLRSPDRGTQWHRWNFGLLDRRILCVAVSPEFGADATVLVGADTGIFRSINGGRSWRQLPFPPDLAPVLSAALLPHAAAGASLFVGTESNGLYVSHDDGNTWTRLAEDVVPDVVTAICLEARAQAAPHLLVATDARIYLSRDGGGHWLPVPIDLAAAESISALCAPLGLAAGAPLLVGTSDGRVVVMPIV